MSMIRLIVRASAAFALAGVALSCDHEAAVLGPAPMNDMFRSYVAIGNSITSGVQSAGINDATQRQSYAFLLAQQMRTRFAYPSLTMPGCEPPIVDWQTGARLSTPAPPIPGSTCSLRNPQLLTDILNNVAVPSASSTEVNSLQSEAHNALTTLFLGGRTQVERALEASPTFVTIWIGNNDVLQAATRGLVNFTRGPSGDTISRGITPVATFTARYDDMIADLRAGAPDVKGVLIGAVQTAATPLLFPAAAFQNPAFLAGFSQAAGGTVTVHPNCTGSASLVSFAILAQMRAYNPATGAGHPRDIVCEKNTPGVPAPVGDIFILDAEDQSAIQAAVAAYNAHIETKANELGFAYVDPNVPTTGLIARLKASGCVGTIPNLGAAATSSPFGTCMSLDGVHPSATGQIHIANEVIGAINAKYSTTLATLPVP
jgi:lysophospholipase L1-like esterase